METNRFYRENIKAKNLVFFQACVEQTDLYIGAEVNLKEKATSFIREYRQQLIDYIKRHPEFLHSLVPIKAKGFAPPIAVDMCNASSLAGVGPMAAVAGAMSKFVGYKLLEFTDEVIVENGGDILIKSNTERIIGVYAGNSPLSGKIALKVSKDKTPCGICTSSGTVGHSLSFGKADAALVVHPDASVADACATALGNSIKGSEDIEDALSNINKVPGIRGALVIVGEAFGAIGDIEICRI
ncbi:MAG: UPF0280 family protein [Clostridiaceae bacterium]|jgi:ApbE superfamily uncharacterized protein (UPF0280 family)|nr:UPF0280 family protein [Clostridiaceae bacterium]